MLAIPQPALGFSREYRGHLAFSWSCCRFLQVTTKHFVALRNERCLAVFGFESCFAFTGSASFFSIWQPVTGAPSTTSILNKDAALFELLDIPQGCVGRAFRELRVF